MPSGKRETQLARVERGEETSLRFNYEIMDPIKMVSSLQAESPIFPGAVSLISTEGCSIQAERDGAWVFEPENYLQSVPVARFYVDNRLLDISLPLNPNDGYPLNACTVAAEQTAGGIRLRTSFSQGRSVSTFIEGTLRSGELVQDSASRTKRRSFS